MRSFCQIFIFVYASWFYFSPVFAQDLRDVNSPEQEKKIEQSSSTEATEIAPEVGPAPEENFYHNTIFDKTHRSIGDTIYSFSENIDNFFGDDRIIQEGNRSQLIIAQSFSVSEGAKPSFTPKIRLKIRLPRTQKRLNLVVDNVVDQFRKDDVDNNLEQSAQGQVNEKDSVTTSLRYVAATTKSYDIHTDAGVKIKFPLDPFASLRARKSFFLENWESRISGNVFWFLNSGAGEIGRVDFEYAINDNLLFRIANSETWLEKDRFFSFVHGFFLFQKLRDDRALSYSAFLTSVSEPSMHIDAYILAVSYRCKVWRDWLFFDITPQVSYPESRNYEPTFSISFRLEGIFRHDPTDDLPGEGVDRPAEPFAWNGARF